jgi:formylglycine-generating enzyme required for sulfatase activity
MTAVTPAGTAGAKSVAVTTAGGTATLTNAFQYLTYPSWATVLEGIPNAAVVTDVSLRAAITATNRPWRVRDNGTLIEMLLVPPGTFMMGAAADDTGQQPNELPQHQVTLTNAFYLGKTEVTQAVWLAETGANPSVFTGDTSRPVETVSWTSCQSFCTTAGLRLPTEAEWEYACRADTTTPLYGVADDIAWHLGNAGGTTHPVGTKLPNALGLYDTIGNVYEHTSDYYGAYAAGSVTNPTGPATGTTRSARGTGFSSSAAGARAAFRQEASMTTTPNNRGFRVARNP